MVAPEQQKTQQVEPAVRTALNLFNDRAISHDARVESEKNG
jgi:hypothetical protein